MVEIWISIILQICNTYFDQSQTYKINLSKIRTMHHFRNSRPSRRGENSSALQSSTFYGYSTKILSDHLSAITPIGLGKLIPLKSKFQLLLGEISLRVRQDSEQQARINPLFKYLLQITIRYDFINNIKATEYYSDLKTDFLAQISCAEVYNALNDTIRQIIRKCTEEECLNQKNNRLRRLQLFEQRCSQLWQRSSHQYMNLLQKGLVNLADSQSWSIIEPIRILLCQNLKKLQPIKSSIMMLRYKRFYQLHKNYFKTSKISKNPGDFSITVSRPSSEPEAVLHTIEDHVYLRKGTAGLEAITINLIKDIARMLEEYHRGVSDGRYQAYYNYLHPKNIIFDQFALKPHLKFQPLLLESLGLRNQPLTLQNRLCFFPTPKCFDYFQSPWEVYPQTQRTTRLILNDPFYGCRQLNGDRQNLLSKADLQDIEKEKKQLQQLKEHQMCWKYLLLSYYLRSGRKFGEDRSQCQQRCIRQHFVNCLRQAEASIRQEGDLSYFLGVKGTMEKARPQQQDLTLKGLLEYLQISTQQQLFQSYLLDRMITYHNNRNILLRQLLKILVANNVLEKMFNIKKYMCIFAVLACEIIEELRSLVDVELAYQGKAYQLREAFGRRVRRLRNGKTFYQYLQTTYERILGYLARQPAYDLQARFIQQSTQGQRHFKTINEVKSVVEELTAVDRKLQMYHQQIKCYGPQRHQSQYMNSLDSLAHMISNNYWRVKKACNQLLVECFKTGSASNHKLLCNDSRTIRSYSLFDRRLQNIIHALFCFQIDALANYELLVLPLLQMPQESKVTVVKIFQSDSNEEQFRNEIVKMETVEQVIGSQFGCELSTVTVLKNRLSAKQAQGQEEDASQGQSNLYNSNESKIIETKQGNFYQQGTESIQLILL